MIPNQRHLFDIPEGVAFFNCASRTPLLRASKAASDVGMAREMQPWGYNPDEAPGEADQVRGLFAALIGAEAGDIAITPSAAYGIKTAALNLPVAAGQRILVPEQPFPSNFYAWRALAGDLGATI